MRYVFSALPIESGRALARVMHLAASYWGFALMSVHLGFHWGVVAGRHIFLIMFLKTEFAFIDYGKNDALLLFQYVAMAGLWSSAST